MQISQINSYFNTNEDLLFKRVIFKLTVISRKGTTYNF